MDKKDMLRALPRVDETVEEAGRNISRNNGEEGSYNVNLSLLTLIVRDTIENVREKIISGDDTIADVHGYILDEVLKVYSDLDTPSLKKVINATGIVLHTNLGRGPLSKEAARAAYNAAVSYSNLEYNLVTGERGNRYSHAEELIKRLTGAEAAVVVNNNAAAVMLILHALGYHKNMIISRGELVEIGGSFRIPSIMEISGVTLKEVGCTNRTRLEDYVNAIDDDTSAILKVHRSNFRIEGYTEDTELSELGEMAAKHKLPLIYDMGSGIIRRYGPIGNDELTVSDAIKMGSSLVCFSGDKLLGGPQAGIICGSAKIIEKIKSDQLIRTLRVDKMTLAALCETLRVYERGESNEVARLLCRDVEELREEYEMLSSMIGEKNGVKIKREYTESEVGGGSLPGLRIKSVCMQVDVEGMSCDELAKRMRTNSPHPIIGRVHEDRYLLDLRTIDKDDYKEIADAIRSL